MENLEQVKINNLTEKQEKDYYAVKIDFLERKQSLEIQIKKAKESLATMEKEKRLNDLIIKHAKTIKDFKEFEKGCIEENEKIVKFLENKSKVETLEKLLKKLEDIETRYFKEQIITDEKGNKSAIVSNETVEMVDFVIDLYIM